MCPRILWKVEEAKVTSGEFAVSGGLPNEEMQFQRADKTEFHGHEEEELHVIHG